MNGHLNLFKYYRQKDALPIENNSTRNLGIVIKNNPLVLYDFLDLVSQKSGVEIKKPAHPSEWFLELQVKIESLAQENMQINNVIGATLTTQETKFYSNSEIDVNNKNITDMVIHSNGTIIIIEAKRDSTDASFQLAEQIQELKNEWSSNGNEDFNVEYISLTWDSIIERLNDINILTNQNDIILNDYIEHIKHNVPAFFPVQTFTKIDSGDFELIRRRIERFADNYGSEVILRDKSSLPMYWVRLTDKKYIRELAYENYNKDLSLGFYPGLTVGQGHSLFAQNNKLCILKTTSISVQGVTLQVSATPYLNLLDAWGKWKGNIRVKQTDPDTLKSIFNELCGKRKGENNSELISSLKKYEDIISTQEFTSKYNEVFKNTQHSYTYIFFVVYLYLH